MASYRLTAPAQEQVARLLARSAAEYGQEAARNYAMLLAAAMSDLAAAPKRLGTRRVSGTAGIWVYDLWYSRNRPQRGKRVRDPWHKLIYWELPQGGVEILAVVGRSYPSGRAARESLRAE